MILVQVLSLAAENGIGGDQLLNYGVLGVFTSILLGVTRTLYKREQQRADENAREVARLNALMLDKQLPVMQTAVSTMERVVGLLDAFQRDREVERATREELQRRRRDNPKQD